MEKGFDAVTPVAAFIQKVDSLASERCANNF